MIKRRAGTGGDRRDKDFEPERSGKRYFRSIATPAAVPRTNQYAAPEELTEGRLQPPGALPLSVIVPARDAGPALLRELEGEVRDLPRLAVGKRTAGLDVLLEDVNGQQVKSGAVILEGDDAAGIEIDEVTRRFRRGDLKPGTYRLRASSASAGRGAAEVELRAGDVTRAVIRLDGERLEGASSARFTLSGTGAARVHVRGTDTLSGKLVVDRTVEIGRRGLVEIKDVPFGKIHWNFDTGDESSCYDSETHDLGDLFIPPLVVLVPPRRIHPDPPEPGFLGLPHEFDSIARVLPELGIKSIRELAAAEPEDLMHRAAKAGPDRIVPVHSLLFGQAIQAARSSLGLKAMAGEQLAQFDLAHGATVRRSILPAVAGAGAFSVEVGEGRSVELIVRSASGVERQTIHGSGQVEFPVLAEDLASGGIEVELANSSGTAVTAQVRTRLPTNHLVPGFAVEAMTVKQRIEAILAQLAVRNPGLGTHVPDAIMEPENIQMWIDRARTFMAMAGVCSMDDLGRFRLSPMRVLKTGAYVAPAAQPPKRIPVLDHYAFSEILSGSVLHYRPNDVLHDTAVVLAGEWDIRGQTVVIAHDVQELVVIAGSITHDGASKITWELPELAPARSYWPNPAPPGANGTAPGEAGQDGGDGDPNPHESRNGGADGANAPTVTFYLLSATNNLPPIELPGQPGGAGGRGQDGGRGGDGATGLRADGTFFGGCCRGVGWGGAGGMGGDAGKGGKGGRGGKGGTVTVLTTPESLSVLAAAAPPINILPGEGGDGGPAAFPGLGGLGGPAGTADCETWCDEHPDRVGANGAGGAAAFGGDRGPPGPAVIEDQLQFLPITPEQWLDEFNRPHILQLGVYEAEPGETVQITGEHFDPAIDHVYFDGVDVGPVATATGASFVVPLDSEGGVHPVVIRPTGLTSRRSNRAMLHVIPKIDDIPAGTRWVENQQVTVTGLAFRPGVQLLAEDRSVSPAASYSLPVVGATRTSIDVQVPGGFLGALRGVRRLVAANPDGGRSRGDKVVRISDTIVVRCAAFRLLGSSADAGTMRSASEIANLFAEGAVHSVNVPWGLARIAFRLVRPVTDVTTSDDHANMWPIEDLATDQAIFTTAGGVLGALNIFFAKDVELATAYAYFGGGPIFVGEEGDPLGAVDWQQVVAHEIGHALCLRHQCSGGAEGPGTFFNRLCGDGDDAFLMYPYWNVSDGMALAPGQVDPARIGASNLEDGKINNLPTTSLFQSGDPPTIAQCMTADAQN